MKKQYRIRLLLSKRWIKTQADVTQVTYLITASDKDTALKYAYELADEEFPGLLVIFTEINPLFN